jgi:hypothetical protein
MNGLAAGRFFTWGATEDATFPVLGLTLPPAGPVRNGPVKGGVSALETELPGVALGLVVSSVLPISTSCGSSRSEIL